MNKIKIIRYWLSHLLYRYKNNEIKGNYSISLPIYGFYHVLCVNNWQDLMKKQILHLKNSGLYDVMDTLFISAIVSQSKDLKVIESIGGDKCKIVVVNDDPKLFEIPALEFIWQKAHLENFYCFYFHSKGISYETSAIHHVVYDFSKLKKCVNRWREMMEYFIFDRYKDAIVSLQKYNTYGCCYTINEYNKKFFSGNFWWSKSEYIRQIPEMTEEQRMHRFFAEHWICSCSDKNFSLFNININPYLSIVPERYYRKDKRIVYSEMVSSIYNHYKFWTKELTKIFKNKFLKHRK